MSGIFYVQPPPQQPAPSHVAALLATAPPGTLALSGAGYEIGDGNDPATMAVLASESMTVAVYADAVPFGSAVYSATGQVTDSSGNLADITDAALSGGTTYIVVVQNESDSEVWVWRMAAT
jgi:hypothetical protein